MLCIFNYFLCFHSLFHRTIWDTVCVQSGKLISWNKLLSQSILCFWIHSAWWGGRFSQQFFFQSGEFMHEAKEISQLLFFWYINKPRSWKSLNPNLLISSAFPDGFAELKWACKLTVDECCSLTSLGKYLCYSYKSEGSSLRQWSPSDTDFPA